jgi:hypothetical protein
MNDVTQFYNIEQFLNEDKMRQIKQLLQFCFDVLTGQNRRNKRLIERRFLMDRICNN